MFERTSAINHFKSNSRDDVRYVHIFTLPLRNFKCAKNTSSMTRENANLSPHNLLDLSPQYCLLLAPFVKSLENFFASETDIFFAI